jgi:hypothetical protein
MNQKSGTGTNFICAVPKIERSVNRALSISFINTNNGPDSTFYIVMGNLFFSEKNVIEETSGKSESKPATPEVEAQLEEATDEHDIEEVKPEGKKVGKKKRLIAPIRIKLTKMSVSQKLHKSLVRCTCQNLLIFESVDLIMFILDTNRSSQMIQIMKSFQKVRNCQL